MGYFSELANWDGSLTRKLAREKEKAKESTTAAGQASMTQFAEASGTCSDTKGTSRTDAANANAEREHVRDGGADADCDGQKGGRISLKSELSRALIGRPLPDNQSNVSTWIKDNEEKTSTVYDGNNFLMAGDRAGQSVEEPAASSSACEREAPSRSNVTSKPCVSKRVDNGSLASALLSYYADENAVSLPKASSSSEVVKSSSVVEKPISSSSRKSHSRRSLQEIEERHVSATPSFPSSNVPPLKILRSKKLAFNGVFIPPSPYHSAAFRKQCRLDEKPQGAAASGSRSVTNTRAPEARRKPSRTYGRARYRNAAIRHANHIKDEDSELDGLNDGHLRETNGLDEGAKSGPVLITSDSELEYPGELGESPAAHITAFSSSSTSITPEKRPVGLPKPEEDSVVSVPKETNLLSPLEARTSVVGDILSKQQTSDESATSAHFFDDFCKPVPAKTEEPSAMKTDAALPESSAETHDETVESSVPGPLINTSQYRPSPDPSFGSSTTLVNANDIPADVKQGERKGSQKSSKAGMPWVDDGIDEEDICHQCSSRNYYAKMKCTKLKGSMVCPLWYCHRCVVKCYPHIQFDPYAKSFHCPRCTEICNCRVCCRRRGLPYKAPARNTWKALGVELLLSEQATQRQSLYGHPGGLKVKQIREQVIVEDDSDDDNGGSGVASSSKLTPDATDIKPEQRVFIGKWQPHWGAEPFATRSIDTDPMEVDIQADSAIGRGKGRMVDRPLERHFAGDPDVFRLRPAIREVVRIPRKPPAGAVDVRALATSTSASPKPTERLGKRARKPSQKAIEAAASAAALDDIDDDDDADADNDCSPSRKRQRSQAQSDLLTLDYMSNSATPALEDFTIPELDDSASLPKTSNLSSGSFDVPNYDWTQFSTSSHSYTFLSPQSHPTNFDPLVKTEISYSSNFSFSNSYGTAHTQRTSTTPAASTFPFKKHSLAAKNANVGLFAPFAASMVEPNDPFASVLDSALTGTGCGFAYGAAEALSCEDVERAVRSALAALTFPRKPFTLS